MLIPLGTDPSFHFGRDGAKTLIDNSLKFAAAGKTPAGVPQTGLYFSLSCYYEDVDSSPVAAVSGSLAIPNEYSLPPLSYC
jgi:hypothetical protein